jgi:hypothetical protein
MTWHRASVVLGLCGNCHDPIGPGMVYALTKTKLLRCVRCTRTIEPVPAVIPDDAELVVPMPPPPDQQAFVSSGELATRAAKRLGNHARNRKRR